MAVTYEPIASQTLGSAAATVTFSSIPGTYTDLVLVSTMKATTGTAPSIFFRVGASSIDTGNNYSWTRVGGTGSTTFSDRTSTDPTIIYSAESNATAECVNIWHLMSYANTNVYKTIMLNATNPNVNVTRVVGLWRSASAITTVQVIQNATTFVSGSTFALYGIKAA